MIRDSRGRLLLWSGLSRRLLASICEALGAAKIAHTETSREFGLLPTTKQSASFTWVEPQDYERARSVLDRIFADPEMQGSIADEADAEGRRKPFSHYPRSVGGYGPTIKEEVNPHSRLLGSAHRIFGDVRDVEPSDLDSPFQDWLSAGDDDLAPDHVPEDFAPEDATTEVWAGDDRRMADYLKDCLSGVGIGCAISDQGARAQILVRPETEKRAREIVREIVEGAPPA